MPDRKLVPTSYKRLVTEIALLYEGVRTALVEAYWKIGQRIVMVEQQGALKAAYGTGLLHQLSQDLTRQCGAGFSEENLRRMRRFYLNDPKKSASTELNWAHYTELLPIGDAAVRERLVKRALEEGLTHKALRELVRQETVRGQVAENLSNDSEGRRDPPELLSVPELGPFFTYKIAVSERTSKFPRGTVDAKAATMHSEIIATRSDALLIDLGFSTVLELDRISRRKFAPDTIVTSIKDVRGDYSVRPPASRGASPESLLYSYQAFVERVIDGDTLKVEIDLGFNIRIREILRLRAIDCPEIDTLEGKAAKRFVERELAHGGFIIVKSIQTRKEKWGRYLGDIFCSNKAGDQVYLNNLLLEKGYAVRVRE